MDKIMKYNSIPMYCGKKIFVIRKIRELSKIAIRKEKKNEILKVRFRIFLESFSSEDLVNKKNDNDEGMIAMILDNGPAMLYFATF